MVKFKKKEPAISLKKWLGKEKGAEYREKKKRREMPNEGQRKGEEKRCLNLSVRRGAKGGGKNLWRPPGGSKKYKGLELGNEKKPRNKRKVID